jgi:4-hydroxy-tetrahydrodipicolinate reductase
MKVAILGAGRMGQALVRSIATSRDLELVGVWSRHAAGSGRSSDLEGLLTQADVAVDFTLPGATAEILEQAARAGKPLVCGVTGLGDELMRRVAESAHSIPLLYDRNMSLGIAVLAEVVALAGASLGPEFCTSIHEVHHVHKKDAPSGTALKLGEALASARKQAFRDVYRFETDGKAVERSPGAITVTAERRGEVAGEHCVRFESGAETLSLSHTVSDRRVFAAGALLAAAWLTRQPPGLYGMRDVVRSRSTGGGQRSGDSVK